MKLAAMRVCETEMASRFSRPLPRSDII
jgi:hypothetical protein